MVFDYKCNLRALCSLHRNLSKIIMLFNPNLPCLCLYSISKLKSAMFRKYDSFYWMMQSHPSKHSSWWRRLDQDEYVCLGLTSSEDVFKTSSRHLGQGQYIRLGHTSSRHFQDVLPRRLQDVLKTSSKRLQDIFKTSSNVLQRYLQDCFQDVSSS